MDEENKGFPIPPRQPMFGGAEDAGLDLPLAPQSDFIMSFANEDGTKAVVLTSVEVLGDEVERHSRDELETYAKTLMDTGDDPFGLQIGTTFEGETAAADAEAEATRLADAHDPGEGATDEELIEAVNAAFEDVGALEEEILEEAPPVELPEEPMLGQLRG